MNWMPTYFSMFLGRDLQTIGIGKPMPYLVMFVMSNAGGWGGDALIASGYAVGVARKIVNTAGFAGAVVTLMVMPSARSVMQVCTHHAPCMHSQTAGVATDNITCVLLKYVPLMDRYSL